ncbi:MAG: tRNA pseudouridine(55) synthase TruB [Chloroflexi bacterium]|nr:tRNA pseudouridine(55) synthase TruB [Chloroflexota bacterium]
MNGAERAPTKTKNTSAIGYISIWKPSGPSSFDVVRRVRKAGAFKTIGHGGTLDPAAEGILPLLVGKASRFSEFFTGFAKAYTARVLLGVRTDTLDLEGQVLETRDTGHVTLEAVQNLLAEFSGDILQTPPMYSALKQDGKRLYALARLGHVVDRPSRQVTVHSISITMWDPPRLVLDIVCGSGTYVRSLAADIGDRLGCGAALEHLTRSRVGPFLERDAISLETAEAALHDGQIDEAGLLMAPDILFPEWPSLHLNEEGLRRAVSGLPVGDIDGRWDRVSGHAEEPYLPVPQPDRAVAYRGRDRTMAALLVMLEDPTRAWRPQKVLVGTDYRASEDVVSD